MYGKSFISIQWMYYVCVLFGKYMFIYIYYVTKNINLIK